MKSQYLLESLHSLPWRAGGLPCLRGPARWRGTVLPGRFSLPGSWHHSLGPTNTLICPVDPSVLLNALDLNLEETSSEKIKRMWISPPYCKKKRRSSEFIENKINAIVISNCNAPITLKGTRFFKSPSSYNFLCRKGMEKLLDLM